MSETAILSAGPIVPSIPTTSIDDPQLRPIVNAMRNIFQTRATGGTVDNWVTWRDLVNNGIVTYQVGAKNYAGDNSLFYPVGPNTDFTTPPAPTNVQANGGFNIIFIDWESDNYSNHAYAEIWRSTTNDLGTATFLGSSISHNYVDSVGSHQGYYYWVRFVSKNNVIGSYQGTTGVFGQSSLDPTYALEVLTASITTDQFYSGLNSRINLIDGSSSVPGSVNARITSEATSRTNADTALASTITTLSSTVSSNTAAISTEASTRASADGSLGAQYTVKVDVNGRVAGFGLASTGTTGGVPTSSFIVIADKFAVVSPSNTGETPKVPFVIGTVDGTTSVVISNALIQDAAISTAKIGLGVITTAKIADAAISTAKIGDAEITTAKIADAQITSAKIASLAVNTANINSAAITAAKIGDGEITNAKIKDVIHSSDFATGTTGWQIDKSGQAEFNNATFRGTLDIKSSPTGSRVEMKNNYIKVFDSSGVVRVQIGDLSA